MITEANEIVAAALETEASLQQSGAIKQLGDAFDPTYARVREVGHGYDEAVAFAFTFWDSWLDSANHNWRYHDPLKEDDWPRFAREIAAAVRQGRLPDNELLLEHIRLKPRRTFRQWFWGLFGRSR